jgi:predicted lipoprotein with Yx(FWY)xxD motif
MALSGSYDYSRNALQIITEAMELIQALPAGQTMASEDSSTCLATLNMMIKAWQAEGISLWTKKDAALFLEYGEELYSIGPSGDNSTTSWVKTEIATAGSTTDLTITVDSDDGVTNGDYIGIELDDGTLQWTTVNGVPAANVITITAALTDDVAVDNHVYTYTTKIQRPIEIADVRIRNSDGYERPLPLKSRQEYMALSNKEEAGAANLVYYDAQLTNGKLYVWQACNNVQEYLKFTAKVPVQDFDALTNDPDFPQEWLLALSWNLACFIAPKFGKELSNKFELRAEMFKQAVSGFDREDTSVFFGVSRR